MIIGGIQKTSLIDYPGNISCVLFTAGCNFECPYCHNPDLVRRTAARQMDPAAVFDFLKKRKPLLDAVVITGGEPTLHPDIVDFCREIKSIGYPIKLDTNGTRPKVLNTLLSQRLLDFIAMDVKTAIDRYVPHIVGQYNSADLRESVAAILHSGLDHEFRTTCVKPIVDSAAIMEIARLISGANRYALQMAVLDNRAVLKPAFFASFDRRIGNKDMAGFRAIAADFVKTVVIR